MVARLTLFTPSQPHALYELDAARRYTVGRDDDCEVVCADDRVSRRHATLAHEAEGWLVEDLGSKNGTLVDAVPITRHVLSDRAWISFGGVLAEFSMRREENRQAEAEGKLLRWKTSARSLTRLGRAGGLSAVVGHLLESLLDLAGMERGYVVLGSSEAGLRVMATRGAVPDAAASEAFAGSASVVRQVVANGAPLVTASIAAGGELATRASIAGGGIHALVCLPLRALGRTLGAVYADSRAGDVRLGELDVEILEALASHAALAIALVRLEEELSAVATAMRARTTLSGDEGQALVGAVLDRALGVAQVLAPPGAANGASDGGGPHLAEKVGPP